MNNRFEQKQIDLMRSWLDIWLSHHQKSTTPAQPEEEA